MAERRPTLAVATVSNLSDSSRSAWKNLIADQGFNTLDASYRHTWTAEGVRTHVEASLGLLVLNREIVDEHSRYTKVHYLHDEHASIRAAHGFSLPVFLTGDPTLTDEFSPKVIEGLQPYELIEGEDLTVMKQRLLEVQPNA